LGQNGRVDILVNSAGYLGGYRPFEDHDSADWQAIISTNLLGVLEICSQVLPHMKRIGVGRIVNMGSLAGKEGLANMPVYSAASACQSARKVDPGSASNVDPGGGQDGSDHRG